MIPDYYPRVISDEAFLAAAGGKASRKKSKGPNSKFVNLFVGLLVGSDGHSLQIQTCRAKRKGRPTYVQRRLTSYGHLRGLPGSCPISVNYDVVEACLLRMIYELDESTLTPDTPIDQRLPAAEARVEAIRRRIAELRGALTDTSPRASPPREIYEAITQLGSQLVDAERELEDARLGGGVDSVAVLRQAHDLVVVLSQQRPEELHALRLRLRSVVSALVKRVRVDIRKRGRRVQFAVTLELKTGETRVIVDGQSVAESLASAESVAEYRVASFGETEVSEVSVRLSAVGRVVVQSPVSCDPPLAMGEAKELRKALRGVHAKLDRRVARRLKE